MHISEGGGENGAERRPHRETKPSAHATTRTTRQINGVIHFVSRANFNEMFPDVATASRVTHAWAHLWVTVMKSFVTKS